MIYSGCTVVLHSKPFGDVSHEHEFTSPGAAMISSEVQFSRGIHRDAPGIAYVFSGQVLHLLWPEISDKKR